MKKKIAIYPGSFNPFTIGHLNILEKAEDTFGKENVIIAVGKNSKKDTSGVNRVATIQANLPSRQVEEYSGLLAEYVWEKETQGYDVTIIRGLRNGFDLQYETNLLRALQDFKPDLKVIFYLCDKQFDHISSSLYREAEAGRPGAGYIYLAKEAPSVKQVSNDVCCIFIDETKIPINEKYVIISKSKIGDDKYKFENSNISFDSPSFEGSYAQCLEWIKEQLAK